MADDLYIGLMSGTSLDGVDAVLVSFAPSGQRTIGTCYRPYPDDIKQEVLALHEPGHNELHRSALLGQKLSQLYASACNQLLAQCAINAESVKAIGCHGQTIRHRPEAGYSLQLNNPALLAELTGIAVVADFRNRDIAAGGQGAPLVPAAHASMFHSASRNRVLLNLGGIANLTVLPASEPSCSITGFDCGPANILMDAWIQEQQGRPFDTDGTWAATGKTIPLLLEKLLSHPFFTQVPPKSCGREEFNLSWLKGFLHGNENASDVQATLLELTCKSCIDAIKRWAPQAEEIYLCGGGANNAALMREFCIRLPACRIGTTSELGIPPDWVEAVAFAWLAQRHVLNLPGNLPSVTGAKGDRMLGAFYPA